MRGWGALAKWAPFFDDAGASPAPWAPGGGGGGGSVLAIGQSIEVPIVATPAASVGNWIIQFINSTTEPFGTLFNSLNTQNNFATWHIQLPAGTYDLDYQLRQTAHDAIHTISIDGVVVATFDGFNSVPNSAAFHQGGIVVGAGTNGDHTFTLSNPTRNAGSDQWQLQPLRAFLTRRA